MDNPWKITTIGLVVAGITAVTSGLTTAWILRSAPVPADIQSAPVTLTGSRAVAPAEWREIRRPPIVETAKSRRITTPVAYQAVAAREPVASSEAQASTSTTAASRAGQGTIEPTPLPSASTAPAATPSVVTPPSAPRTATQTPTTVASAPTQVPADCASGGDRAMRIAKPGALGTLVGAGLGAVGGAIADGGKGAGKGALWGGVAGAAMGTGYGAYKTKQECRTIFGSESSSAPAPAASANRAVIGSTAPSAVSAGEAPLAPRTTDDRGDRITIYNAK